MLVFLAFMGYQVYRLNDQRIKLEEELSKITPRVEALAQENESLKKDIEYFANPENLLKELKSKFNYKLPDEKMIIVVPPRNQTSTN